MHLEQFEYIVEVAKTKSISLAAEKLHISQSGISKSITSMEEELGIKIFKRSRFGADPTDEGKKIIKTALEIIIKIQELKETALLQNGTLSYGELRLASIPSMLMTYLPKTLAIFKKDYPHVDVEIMEKGSPDIIKDVKQNKIDIGLVYIDENIWDDEDLIFDTLVETKIHVCVSKNSPLAYNDIITPQDLVNEPIVIYNSLAWKKFADKHFKDHGGANILFISNNTEVVKKTVAEGLSVGFSTELALKEDQYVTKGNIVSIPFIHHEQITRLYGWIRSKNKHFSITTREFLKYLRSQIQKEDF